MYLEMVNVNHTALRIDPIRLIMKMGDDLRQDMMTLRMLSLFEKVYFATSHHIWSEFSSCVLRSLCAS